jgi:hypothetical protein
VIEILLPYEGTVKALVARAWGKEWGAARDGNTLSRRGGRRYRSIGKEDETAQEDRVTKVASASQGAWRG